MYSAENDFYVLLKSNQTIQKVILFFSVFLAVFHSFFSWDNAPQATFVFSTASSVFGTQRQLTHAPVKNSTLPLRNMPVFQGIAPWRNNFTLSCIIPIWDSTTAHSPSDKGLNHFPQEDALFSRALHLGILISLYPTSSLFETQH